MLRPAVHLALALAAFLCLASTLARLSFAVAFAPADASWPEFTGAVALGARYDLRLALLSIAPMWLLSILPWSRWPGASLWRHRVWWAAWMTVAIVWALAWVLDAGHYAYLQQRLSAVLLSLARDPGEALGMVWQSYPVLWIVSGILLWGLVCHGAFQVLWRLAESGTELERTPWLRFGGEAAVVALALLAIHGRLSQYPLRWSDAVELPHHFARQLALNPLQNFYDTWSFRSDRLDEQGVRPYADEIRRFVGLPPLQPGEPVSFARSVPAKPGAKPLNIVVVLLESFAGHKTGALGNPLGATPHFDALASEGLLFTRMMSAHAHTARGVFATLTGIPDVSIHSTASRNPQASQQHTIVNELKQHAKFYFIGGSTSWANVRGVLNASIDNIEIYELGRLTSPARDVWGVSDKDLLLEANATFRAQKRPFFAVVQTSGNHRPYTIPEEDRGAFRSPTPTLAQLQQYGFASLQEFEAFAYLDWCIGHFMAQAREEAYFENTLFAFIGDHGITGPTGPHMPPAWRELAITQGHTPLLIYAPGRLTPRRIDHWAQQVDVLPTLASLAGVGYRNTTLGRDLLDPQFDATRVAFTFQFSGPNEAGLLIGSRKLIDRPPMQLHDIQSMHPSANLLDGPVVQEDVRSLLQQWETFPRAFANVALYLQTHNPKLAD